MKSSSINTDAPVFEPSHEVMALVVLHKLILKSRMLSHPVGLDIWSFGQTLLRLPYFMFANSDCSGETARMRRLAWAFAGRLCGKCRNIMSWLICSLFQNDYALRKLYSFVNMCESNISAQTMESAIDKVCH